MNFISALTGLASVCLMVKAKLPDSSEDAPTIIGPNRIRMKAHPGDVLFLHCEALTNRDDVTLIYWLVDGKFPEDTPSGGRMTQTAESVSEEGAVVQRSLLLKNVTSRDLKSTFTCTVMNSAGAAEKHVTLTESGCSCYIRERR